MMMTFTRKRSLSLGFRYRCLLTFAVLLPALLSGVTAARAEAPIFDLGRRGGNRGGGSGGGWDLEESDSADAQ